MPGLRHARVRFPFRLALVAVALPALGGFIEPRTATAQCPMSSVAADFVKAGDELRATDLLGAIQKYEAAVRTSPRSARAHASLAAAEEKREAWQKALEHWTEASSLAPKHAGYAFACGRTLLQLKRWTEAVEPLERTLVLDERHADAHTSLAYALIGSRERASRDREAAVHLERAIELRPDEPARYVTLGRHLSTLGFPREATATVKAGLDRAGNADARFELRILLGDIADDAGDLPGAIAHLEAALHDCQGCSDARELYLHQQLGNLYVRSSPPRNAEALVHLTTFMKRACKGAAAARYAQTCTLTQATLARIAPFP